MTIKIREEYSRATSGFLCSPNGSRTAPTTAPIRMILSGGMGIFEKRRIFLTNVEYIPCWADSPDCRIFITFPAFSIIAGAFAGSICRPFFSGNKMAYIFLTQGVQLCLIISRKM